MSSLELSIAESLILWSLASLCLCVNCHLLQKIVYLLKFEKGILYECKD